MTDISATSFFRATASTGPATIGEPRYEPDDGEHKELWDSWHPQLQPTMHRHLAVDLPSGHPAHNTRLPLHERAHALLDHVANGAYTTKGLGYHWTDDPDYNHLNTGSRIEPGQTPVTVHARTAPRHHIEDNTYVLEDRAVRDWDTDPEREVPLKRGAPVHVTGISWKSVDGRQHHTFDTPITHHASLRTTASAATWHTVRHYDAENLARRALGRDGIRAYSDHGEAQTHADQITTREGLPPVKIVPTTHPDQSGYVHSHPHANGGAILGLGSNALDEGVLIHELTHHRVHHLGVPMDDHHAPAFADHLGQMLDTHHSNPSAGAAFRNALQHTDREMRNNPSGTSATFGTPYPPAPAPSGDRPRGVIPLRPRQAAVQDGDDIPSNPSIPQADLDSARHEYHLTGRPRMAAATKPCPCCGGHGKTASTDSLDHLRQAGYNTDDWAKWQQGRCGTYACSLIAKHPHLRFGVMGVEDEDGWAPTHYFAHDDHHAYDSAGKHPLPYHGIDGHANYTELDSHPDDWGLPHEESGPEGPEPHLAEAAEHAERHQIVQGRYGPHARKVAFTTPVPDNHEPYQREHPWLPRDHFFAPGEKGLDPRLFDENERMHPIVRQHILSLLNSFWAPKYGDSWQSWARVYLAGSEASHFYGNGDLDVLIGVDYDRARDHAPALASMSDEEISTHLTDELRHGLNDPERMLPGPDGKETGPWESTWYVNPDSYDIRDIKPYAAYDITRDEWAVKPVEVPDDFGPEKLPESTWDVFEALQKLIGAIRELPDGTREREGAALYDYLHADRHSAFGPEGSGLYDPANAVWKALDKAPGKPLQQLIDWKHAHEGASAATDLEKAA